MRYIGGKSLLLDRIDQVIQANTKDVHSFIDLFSGSGVVGNYFKTKGYQILSNDFLYFSFVLSRGSLGINRPIEFKNLNFNVFDYLNGITLEQTRFSIDECFILRHYSPYGDCERMYFQEDNALRIDLIRLTIEQWKEEGYLDEDEYYYLLASLLNAVPYVSNIAGVYGAYLKFWDKRTYNKLKLEPIPIVLSKQCSLCKNMDYKHILREEYDIMYADPPYNAREYLPNYHILETIARYDYPVIKGVTGLRDYSDQKSEFCKKSTVEGAFETLVSQCGSRYLLISYNNEGLLPSEKLQEICRTYAAGDSFKLIEWDYRRYKNKIPNNTGGLKEQLYLLRRN